MKALHWMDRYRKEVLQVSTWKHGINVQYLYDIWRQNIIRKLSVKFFKFSFSKPMKKLKKQSYVKDRGKFICFESQSSLHWSISLSFCSFLYNILGCIKAFCYWRHSQSERFQWRQKATILWAGLYFTRSLCAKILL